MALIKLEDYLADKPLIIEDENSGKVFYKSQPKQTLFHYRINNRYINGYRDFLYGGSGGGGKTKALRFQAHRDCLAYPGLKVLLLRSTFPELEQTHLQDIQKDFPGTGNKIGLLNKSNYVYNYYNKSFLRFGHILRYEDFDKYLSTEYDVIMADELTTIPFRLILLLKSMRLRTTRTDFIPYFAAATNPGSRSHSEVKSYFLDKDFKDKYSDLAGAYYPEKVSYTRALVYDNKILMDNDPEYISRMMSLPPDERKRLLEGSWDIFVGQFFKKFRQDIHVIDPFTIPLEWQRLAGLDYGSTTCLEALAYDRKNNTIYVTDEWFAIDATKESKANSLAEFLRTRGLSNINIYYDTNMQAPNKEVANDKTPIQVFREKRLNLLPVSKRKSKGVENKNFRHYSNEEIKTLLDWEQDKNGFFTKRPKLYIFSRCKYLISSLPALIHDEKDDQDIDKDANDHAYDAMKYPIMHLRYKQNPAKDKATRMRMLRAYRSV